MITRWSLHHQRSMPAFYWCQAVVVKTYFCCKLVFLFEVTVKLTGKQVMISSWSDLQVSHLLFEYCVLNLLRIKQASCFNLWLQCVFYHCVWAREEESTLYWRMVDILPTQHASKETCCTCCHIRDCTVNVKHSSYKKDIHWNVSSTMWQIVWLEEEPETVTISRPRDHVGCRV